MVTYYQYIKTVTPRAGNDIIISNFEFSSKSDEIEDLIEGTKNSRINIVDDEELIKYF